MQNEKKYIRYKGVTRLPSEHDSYDGELEEVINMSLVGEELRPVLPPEIIGTIPGQLMFVHKNMGYEHFIYLDGNVVKAYKHESGSLSPISCNINIGVATLTRVDAVGNTLIILTSTDILYALWDNISESYKSLGGQIPFPLLKFSLVADTTISTDKTYPDYSEDIRKLGIITGSYVNYVSPGRIARSSGSIRRPSVDRDSIVSSDFENEIFGVINKNIADISENGSLLFPFFVRYAIRMYDGSLIRHSQPFLMLPTKFVPFAVGILGNPSDNKIRFYFSPSKLHFKSSLIESLRAYSDVVSSIDIFISPPIYTYIQDGNINGAVANPLSSTPEKIFAGMIKDKESILEEIGSVGNFYLLKSIPINETVSDITDELIEIEGLDNIATKELMTDDYLTHNRITAENSYTYNHKLHLTGVRQKPFTGFKYTSTGSICYAIRGYGIVEAESAHYVGPQPFIFYPDTKASSVIHFIESAQGLEGVALVKTTLSEHKYLNGSFYLDPDLNNAISTSKNRNLVIWDHGYQELQNVLFVSAHQNPFIFPASSRITLPVGKILSVSSNTEAISQGQFGQFPLYAFTDDGIWALEVAIDGKYTARQAVSREVAINSNIMQMDKALAFITAKGVSLLSGQNTEHISEIIRENNRRGSKLSISSILTALDSGEMQSVYNTDVPFETFTAGATLAFDHITGSGRILVINPLYSYAYVFDIGSSSWSKITSSYKRVVNNYPDCYVQDGEGVVYNLSHIPDALDNTTTCMIVTRPIKYNDLNFVIRSLSHRGIFKSVLNVGIYASRNGQDYHLIKTGKEKLIRMTGSGYMYYKILVIANLKSNEVISGIDLDFMVKYSNRMR